MYIDNIFSIGCQSQMMTPNDQNLTIQSGGNNFFLVGFYLVDFVQFKNFQSHEVVTITDEGLQIETHAQCS